MSDEFLPERCADVLTVLREFCNHRCRSTPSVPVKNEGEKRRTSNGSSTVRVEVSINLIEEIEGSWITFLDRKDYDRRSVLRGTMTKEQVLRTHSESDECLLTSRELLNLESLVDFRIERHANGNTSVTLHSSWRLLFIHIHLLILSSYAVSYSFEGK